MAFSENPNFKSTIYNTKVFQNTLDKVRSKGDKGVEGALPHAN